MVINGLPVCGSYVFNVEASCDTTKDERLGKFANGREVDVLETVGGRVRASGIDNSREHCRRVAKKVGEGLRGCMDALLQRMQLGGSQLLSLEVASV